MKKKVLKIIDKVFEEMLKSGKKCYTKKIYNLIKLEYQVLEDELKQRIEDEDSAKIKELEKENTSLGCY